MVVVIVVIIIVGLLFVCGGLFGWLIKGFEGILSLLLSGWGHIFKWLLWIIAAILVLYALM